MQNDQMAAALGVNVESLCDNIRSWRCVIWMAGAILAPISGVIPIIGITYIAKAFIVVIGGGATVIGGTASASTLFGTISQLVTFATTPIIGEVALLAAIILLRLFPQGITGSLFSERLVRLGSILIGPAAAPLCGLVFAFLCRCSWKFSSW